MAKAKTNETYIVQASLTIITYDHKNMFIVQATGEERLFVKPEVSKTARSLATSSSDSFPSRNERWKEPPPFTDPGFLNGSVIETFFLQIKAVFTLAKCLPWLLGRRDK